MKTMDLKLIQRLTFGLYFFLLIIHPLKIVMSASLEQQEKESTKEKKLTTTGLRLSE